MANLVDIVFAPAPFEANVALAEQFYLNQLAEHSPEIAGKTLRFLSKKSGIQKRHFVIPDIASGEKWLYRSREIPSLETRMLLFSQLAPRLAGQAISQLLEKTGLKAKQITHFITVSCTGQTTPGLEWTLARDLGLEHTEKFPLNFLGCHAGLKALSLAKQLANSQADANVLVVAVELSSLHFYPASEGEDMVPNLLFADGAAAALVTSKRQGDASENLLQIAKTGHAFVPQTSHMMTWNLSSSAFRMYLSAELVAVIEEHVKQEINNFLGNHPEDMNWAVHPGGIRILDAVEHACGLVNGELDASRKVYEQYGNMSSVTILAIAAQLMKDKCQKPLLALAFGPGVSMEFCLLQAPQ